MSELRPTLIESKGLAECPNHSIVGGKRQSPASKSDRGDGVPVIKSFHLLVSHLYLRHQTQTYQTPINSMDTCREKAFLNPCAFWTPSSDLSLYNEYANGICSSLLFGRRPTFKPGSASCHARNYERDDDPQCATSRLSNVRCRRLG